MTQCFDAVTNRASLDYYIMPYGRHRGKLIYTIYKKYPDYFAWMLDNSSDEIKEVLLHILDKEGTCPENFQKTLKSKKRS